MAINTAPALDAEQAARLVEGITTEECRRLIAGLAEAIVITLEGAQFRAKTLQTAARTHREWDAAARGHQLEAAINLALEIAGNLTLSCL